ncbi:hypothetical protein PRK78_002567 [Emydomyces testavorans]|uniref:Tafazzin n=1 Tax=Emydomyces testavorans TaxID=2070801 RepID=A0AAF0DEJ1_9EURO|nr:hypothetical protein PRK78_002567 [Emydomyces testavorans]
MPKKHPKFKAIKPEASVHHSLASSSFKSRNDGAQSDEHTVNDLIQRLRQVQLSKRQVQNVVDAAQVTAKSMHPSIRNILELPETPPPRPRPGLRPQTGTRRLRRTPGPAAPLSWLSPTTNSETPLNNGSESGSYRGEFRRCLDQLPGIDIPPERSLQHAILKVMARNWDWHLVYDGVFLSELPTHVKQLLLSYVAVYTKHAAMGPKMEGLKPLFMDRALDGELEAHPDVARLDLCGALGRWISLKGLTRELKCENPTSKKENVHVPASWEDEASDETSLRGGGLTYKQPPLLRFENLRYLSLAQPAPAAANWMSLLALLSHLATLTHLSLAHWPIPTLSVNTAVKRGFSTPIIEPRPLPSEDNLTEAATVLAKLSRLTYCLQWLDLEGCVEWFPALCWRRGGQNAPLGQVLGPEWNGSWRRIKWLGLGPGFTRAHVEANHEHIVHENSVYTQQQAELSSLNLSEVGGRWAGLRPVPAPNFENQHATEEEHARASGDETVQKAARLRLQERMWHLHMTKATDIRKCIQSLRSEAKGKWIEIFIGDEDPNITTSYSPSTI